MKYMRVPTEKIIRLYVCEQRSLRQIGRLVGMHSTSVRERLLGAGVALRPRGQYDRFTAARRRAQRQGV